MVEQPGMNYVARRPCGCVCMVVADVSRFADEIEACREAGLAIEQATDEQIRTTHWLSDCVRCRPERHLRQQGLDLEDV